MGRPLRLARHRYHAMHIPYVRPVRWAGHVEAGVDVLLLVLETEDGIRGVGETPVRLNWHAVTLKSLMAVLDEVFLPQMRDLDLADESAVGAFLRGFREHPLAKSLVDTACWDLRAQIGGIPLWRRLGAADAKVPISWTVTRAAPLDMAREAAQARSQYGVTAFKIKTGQGFETDQAALKEIRQAVGADAHLFADSNGAGQPREVPEMSKMLAGYGVILFEDPCAFAPNDDFRALRKTARLPIMVDNGCRSIQEASLYLGAGAEALSVKIMKTGISESNVIARLAHERKARVAVGISAASSLGAINALSLSASLSPELRCAPCEETFFTMMEDILLEPLPLKDGTVELPGSPGLESLVDWKKVASLSAP